jgi:hypothetical protein
MKSGEPFSASGSMEAGQGFFAEAYRDDWQNVSTRKVVIEKIFTVLTCDYFFIRVSINNEGGMK